MKSLNEQLYELYNSKWTALSQALQESVRDDPETPTNPLLLYVDNEEAWQQADLRVMIFGQETNDWDNWNDPSKKIDHLRKVYDGFFNKGACWSYGGHFWNGVARFKKLLGEKLPGKKIQYLWNNIIKVGKADEAGRPQECIYSVERALFRVIPDEVSILKPNAFLFLSGPYYDDAIRNNFGEVGYTPVPPFEEKQLAKLNLPLTDVAFAFRTYHPRYLFNHDINSYFNAIIDGIS